MNNYMNYIMQNITKTNHNTSGGYITEYDFATDHPNGNIVENIISDWIFDKECKENTGVYSKSIKRRFRIWSNDVERICWRVHGWASKEKQLKIEPRGLK